MIESIRLLSEKINVSGAEKELSDYLFHLLKEKELDPEMDELGNVIVTNKKVENPDLLICCPLDNPGFLALCQENNSVFLSSTGKMSKSQKEITHFIDSKGKSYKIQSKNEIPEYYVIKKKEFHPGEVFRIPSILSEKEGAISGFFSTRYALIYSVLALCDLTKEKPVAICFTTGFHSPSKSENCLVKKLCPKSVILLNTLEEKNLSLLVKDGKHCAEVNFKNQILDTAMAEKISLCEKVSDEAVTKAETIAIPGEVRVASLTLPCQNKGSATETVKIAKIRSLTKLLSKLIKKL